MKQLQTLLFICVLGLVKAQNAPTIDGDLLICPYDFGTASITSTETYDTYQWYFKYWFTEDVFEVIDDATSSSFTYDWYTYDQALLKVVVTLGDQTFESNEIQIDSYNWSSLVVVHEPSENVVSETGSYYICDGDTIVNEVGSPYAICQWYKNDVAIEGATGISYTITEPGEYHVVAAPDFCPNSTSMSLPISVFSQADCTLSIENPENIEDIKIYPNPVNDFLSIDTKTPLVNTTLRLIDVKGRIIRDKQFLSLDEDTEIDTSNLSLGVYFLVIETEKGIFRQKIIKR